MDPSELSLNFPASPSPPVMYNFFQIPPIANPDYKQEVEHFALGGSALHSCAQTAELQKEYLKMFWEQQILILGDVAMYKQHNLPLARIKKSMKCDKAVKMVSAETPVLVSKACELFIMELTIRSWILVEEFRRETIRRTDMIGAIYHADELQFLLDAVPLRETETDLQRGHAIGVTKREV